jgi:chorismate mutase
MTDADENHTEELHEAVQEVMDRLMESVEDTDPALMLLAALALTARLGSQLSAKDQRALVAKLAEAMA